MVFEETSMTSAATTAAVEVPPAEPLVGNYFVAVYPPFSCWQPAQLPAVEEALQRPADDSPMGIYVHIPFCQKKCDYCYYLSFAGTPARMVDDYIGSVVEEAALYSDYAGVGGRPVSFVYFGGGTPSTLTNSQLGLLAAGLKNFLPWKGVQEVTFECAPCSVRPELLQMLRQTGVTRLSMGVQSLDNAVLRANGRMHLTQDVARAYGLIQEARFDWVNLDLMVGLIGETPEGWENTMRRMIELRPDSVTIYQTEIPHNTLMYQRLKQGRERAPSVSWGEKRARLDAGFKQLERAGYKIVSAYSAVRDPDRHQFQYQHCLWRGGDMLGLGVAAFSYFGGVHFQNAVTPESYRGQVRRGDLPLQRALRLTQRDQLVREFVLQLKLGEVSVGCFRDKFGEDITHVFAPQLSQLSAEGFLTVSGSAVRLTRAGLLCVDRLLPRFYDPQHQALRYT